MGQFSFKTQDNNKSVRSGQYNRKGNKLGGNAFLISPTGEIWEEKNYEGYGVFGGKDIYELLSELNGGNSCRMEGIAMAFNDGNTKHPHGDNKKLVWPNLIKFKKNAHYDASRGVVQGCPNQGRI